jgi:phosphate transporter
VEGIASYASCDLDKPSAAHAASPAKLDCESRNTSSRIPVSAHVNHSQAVAGAQEGIELAELPPSALAYRDRTVQRASQAQSQDQVRRREKVCALLEAEMKFSHSIQFNAVPDWSSHYISYSNLKKLIYQLEKQINQTHHQDHAGNADGENSPLLNGSVEWDDPDKTFTRKLDEELEKICTFYQLKELEIVGEVDSLLRDEEEFEAEHDGGEADGDGGSGRPSAWARARQQSIFRSFHLPRNKRRSSTMSSKDHEAAIPEEDDSEDEDANEQSALKRQKSVTDTHGSTQASHKKAAKDLATGETADMRGSAELRRRPSTMFNDFGDDALQALYDEGITLKKRTVNLYVNVCELRSFIQLNETGFGKVLKKYDKTLDRKLKTQYINANVKPAYPFQQSTLDHLATNLDKLEHSYAGIVTKGDVDAARRELRLHLREHVVWERNTVWREMIGIERKAQAANLGIRQTMLGRDTDPKKARLQGDNPELATKEVQTPVGKYTCPKFLVSGTFWTLICIIAIFAVLLAVPIMKSPVEQNCLAMVIFVSLLWATEVSLIHCVLPSAQILILPQAIPLFVTSILVPFLVVVLQVVRQDEKPHARLESKEAARYIFAAMWTPVIMLLLGGFTIAAALSKYNIAKMMATFVLSKAGTKPRTVLLTSMGVAMFASMWISNVAAPVLCFSIIQVCSPSLTCIPQSSFRR